FGGGGCVASPAPPTSSPTAAAVAEGGGCVGVVGVVLGACYALPVVLTTPHFGYGAPANAPAQSEEPIAISSGTATQNDGVGQRSGVAGRFLLGPTTERCPTSRVALPCPSRCPACCRVDLPCQPRRPACRRVALLPARRIAACASPCLARAEPPCFPHRPTARAALLLPALLRAALLAAAPLSASPCLCRRAAARPAFLASRGGSAPLLTPPRFPPMTAPQQTLHMDVWGPACVSTQDRERYFLLVVHDYTHYTTVFPLRSKGQVLDFLIPWIRVVRLQLRERFRQDLPVLRLHSDRGGEFSSDLLRYFCRGEGILQSFTLPASPQQNGVAERRIGLVMEVARTSMIHAAAPHFLWPFAVQYAAHRLNIWPRVSLLETSPTLRWTGKVGDASVFRVWGSHAFVRDTSTDKLSARAIPCVFLGFTLTRLAGSFTNPPRAVSSPLRMSRVSRLDPLPGTVPVEIDVDSSAAKGVASGGATSEGTMSRGAEPASAEPEGAEPGGAESEGAESGGAEPGGCGFWGC
ncbi:unnamed protein product, partial [Closterium sp. NIES-53]